MTKQTVTTLVAAGIFLVCVALVSFIPVPFVTWTPGSTYDLLSDGPDGSDEPLIRVTNAKTYPTTGELHLTTVGVTPVDGHVTLIQALTSFLVSSQATLPRDAIYQPQYDADTLTSREAAQMGNSQSTAIVAAVREAGFPVQEYPVITTVAASGAAANILEPGDLITGIDDSAVLTVEEVGQAIAKHRVGDPVIVTFIRSGRKGYETLTTKASAADPNTPVIGITVEMGYTYLPRVGFHIDPAIGGPSGGLMFSLAIYDKLSSDDLVAGRIIAGTGTIDVQGQVGAIGGIDEKIAGAVASDASIFLMPADNCANVTARTDIQLVPVSSLTEAIRALETAKTNPDLLKKC